MRQEQPTSWSSMSASDNSGLRVSKGMETKYGLRSEYLRRRNKTVPCFEGGALENRYLRNNHCLELCLHVQLLNMLEHQRRRSPRSDRHKYVQNSICYEMHICIYRQYAHMPCIRASIDNMHHVLTCHVYAWDEKHGSKDFRGRNLTDILNE